MGCPGLTLEESIDLLIKEEKFSEASRIISEKIGDKVMQIKQFEEQYPVSLSKYKGQLLEYQEIHKQTHDKWAEHRRVQSELIKGEKGD